MHPSIPIATPASTSRLQNYISEHQINLYNYNKTKQGNSVLVIKNIKNPDRIIK